MAADGQTGILGGPREGNSPGEPLETESEKKKPKRLCFLSSQSSLFCTQIPLQTTTCHMTDESTTCLSAQSTAGPCAGAALPRDAAGPAARAVAEPARRHSSHGTRRAAVCLLPPTLFALLKRSLFHLKGWDVLTEPEQNRISHLEYYSKPYAS